jgi:hypothetical protein
MSEQIVLAEYSGNVILVNGICYKFTGRTPQSTEDLDVTELFDTCEECTYVSPCNNTCDPSLRQNYTIALSGLDTPWGGSHEDTPGDWNGSHTVYNKEPHPLWPPEYPPPPVSDCAWGPRVIPAGSSLVAGLVLAWDTRRPGQWSVTLHAYTATFLVWEGPTDPCDPRGSYGDHVECKDQYLPDYGYCLTQGATTCTVS